MWVQCAMGAMTAGAAATGVRAWLAARAPAWASAPAARRTGKVAFVTVFVLGAGVLGGAPH